MRAPRSSLLSLCLHVLESELKSERVRESRSEGEGCCATERCRSRCKRGRDEGIRENIKREERSSVCVCRHREQRRHNREKRRTVMHTAAAPTDAENKKQFINLVLKCQH